MRRMPWATYFWPGLPQLWTRGSWSALVVSIAAAVLLNLALLGSFGWGELVDPDLRRALWAALAVAWVASAIISAAGNRRQQSHQHGDPSPDAYGEVLEHYLKGNWFEAERALGGLLRKDSQDPDARLMLVALLRHTGRPEEAAGQLDLLERLEGAQKWEPEIRRERELLAEASTKTDVQEEQTSDTPTPEATDPTAGVMHAA